MKTKDLKNLLKAIAKLKLDKVMVSGLSGVLIKDGFLHATNLESGLRVKIDWGGGDLFIDAGMWKKLTTNFKEFGVDSMDASKVHLSADGAKISISRTDIDKYPSVISEGELKLVMDATANDIKTMVRGLDYVSTDELRPAMTQVALTKDHIVSTDAHRLMFVKSDGKIHSDVLIRPDVIKMVNDLGWDQATIYTDGVYLFMYNEYDMVWCRIVDDKYPNWDAVIPQENPITVEVDRKKMIESIKQAMVFANSTTKQVAFSFNGSAVLKAHDIDFEHEYSKEFDGLYRKVGEDIEIGFNGGYLMDVLSDVSGDVAQVQMSDSKRPAIINGEVLLMPVMLNNN